MCEGNHFYVEKIELGELFSKTDLSTLYGSCEECQGIVRRTSLPQVQGRLSLRAGMSGRVSILPEGCFGCIGLLLCSGVEYLLGTGDKGHSVAQV